MQFWAWPAACCEQADAKPDPRSHCHPAPIASPAIPSGTSHAGGQQDQPCWVCWPVGRGAARAGHICRTRSRTGRAGAVWTSQADGAARYRACAWRGRCHCAGAGPERGGAGRCGSAKPHHGSVRTTCGTNDRPGTQGGKPWCGYRSGPCRSLDAASRPAAASYPEIAAAAWASNRTDHRTHNVSARVCSGCGPRAPWWCSDICTA